MVPQNCHPDRSVAQWRDLLFLFQFSCRHFRSPEGAVFPVKYFAQAGCDTTRSKKHLNKKKEISG